MFKSIYADQLSQYYILRIENLSDSAGKHELCYLKRFDFTSTSPIAEN